MNWFYVDSGKKVGPVGDEDIKELVQQGIIKSDSLVWNEVVSKWLPYGSIITASYANIPGSAARSSGGQDLGRDKSSPADSRSGKSESTCAECGGAFQDEEMIQYGRARICATCKPVFFQKLKEGTDPSLAAVYGGFWIRFGAKIIDGIILGAANIIFSLAGGFAGSPIRPGAHGPVTAGLTGTFAVVYILQLAFAATYSTFFVGKFAATPGKMACGLKVITPDGGSIGYGRALGRHFAEFLSGLTLAIGYIMAAFDGEKRALHDRICNTRVIRK